MLVVRLFILSLLFVVELWVAQPKKNVAYQHIRNQFAYLKVNDTTAVPYAELLISLAKKEKNEVELTYAYQDALNYHSSAHLKLKYADSAVISAHRSCRDDLIAAAYMDRGVVNYFNFKDYQLALNDYMIALPYTERSGNPNLYYKLLYLLGIVKSYLGAYQQAVFHFETCSVYYQKEVLKNPGPKILRDMRRGYFNSMQQFINCHQQLGQNDVANFLISSTEMSPVFYKARGVSEYRKGNFEQSIDYLNRAFPELIKGKDFAAVAVLNFYLGKNKLAQHKQKEAIVYLKKVDSIYQQHHFFIPELTENYKMLMDNARQESKMEEVLAFSNTLHQIEEIRREDSHHIIARWKVERLNKEYENKKQQYKTILISVITGSMFLLAIMVNAYFEMKSGSPFESLSAEKNSSTVESPSALKMVPQKRRLRVEVRERIRNNLQKFEDEKEFLEAKLCLKTVAARVGTNINYLSTYINTEKGNHFNRYLSELRIHHIAQQMAVDLAVANKGSEELANLCGIASPSNFLKLFSQIHGISLQDYQHQCRESIIHSMP